MEPKIAYKVSRESFWKDPCGNCIADYKVSCGTGEHSLYMEFEYDENIPNYLWLNFHKKIGWSCYWSTKGWFQSLRKRFSGSLTLFFKGYIELEETFTLDGIEHIDAFIDALQEGKNRILTYYKKEKSR